VPEHVHLQDILWFRLDPTLSVGLGGGFVASLGIPLDFRDISVAYETMDGAAYTPPYDDIHHRTELLAGPGDATVMLRYSLAPGGVLLTGGLGSSLPFGKTEANPYEAGAAGEKHQHMQLGTGTFLPVLSVEASGSSQRWGGYGSASGRLSLYANDKGYQAPSTASVSGGPLFRLTPKVTLLAGVEGAVESPEAWGGVLYVGRAAIGVSASVVGSISEAVTLQGDVRANVWELTELPPEEGAFHQLLTASVGVSWTFGRQHQD
jgi:hypothetical protein